MSLDDKQYDKGAHGRKVCCPACGAELIVEEAEEAEEEHGVEREVRKSPSLRKQILKAMGEGEEEDD